MRGLLTLARRDFTSYFVSPVAYVVGAVFLILSGFVFYGNLSFFLGISLEALMRSQAGGGFMPPLNVNEFVIRPFFGFLAFSFLGIIPMLTMGLLAEEKKRGTEELLLTSPLTSLQLVGGKFLAALGFLGILLFPTVTYQIIMLGFGNPDTGPMLAGYLGALLLGGSLISLGLFVSSLTANQIIAVILSYGLFLILWVIGFFSEQVGEAFGAILSYLSILEHYEDFSKGVVDLSGLAFFVSMILFGLLLTVRSIDSLRWRS